MIEIAVWLFITALVAAAALAGLAAWVIASSRARQRVNALDRENAALEATVRGYESQLDQAQSNSLLAQQLVPMAAQLRTLGDRVHTAETQREQQHGALAQQLRASLESEERLRASADSLSQALSSSQSRGMWGEVQLQRVVEAAGMIERVDFDTQTSTADGSSRPDMVVHLPGDRHLALDAKAPFDAYLRASALPSGSEHAAERSRLLAEHARVLRGHVDALAKREYARKIAGAPEVVVLFVPSEALLSSALDADPGLLEHAFSKSIALASPVTLFSLLRAIATTWSQTEATDEAHEILRLTTELYERLATMAGHISSLRKSIESTVKHFNSFNSTLETRVLVSARKLEKLSRAKTIEGAADLDSALASLTAAEFADGDD